MRKLLLLLFCIVTLHSFSQQYGNEWIDFSQKYYKIGVTSKGIYRVTFSDMSVAGIPVGDIIPSNLQLFYKGQQQYIYVNGEADGILNGSDYLEFYGEPNNGWFDSTFYNDPKQLVNPNYSLVNDTAYYFLTWSNSPNGKRMTVENDISFNSYTAIDYCMREVRQDYLTYYNSTEEGCYYNDGEGYVNDYFDFNEADHSPKREKTLATPNYISNPVNTKVSYCIVGANSTNHSIRISGLGAVIDTSYSGYITINNSFTTGLKIAQNSTLSAKSLLTNTDKNAWAWISILYSHSMDFENAGYFQFGLPKISASKYRLDITNFNGDAGTVFYDITNHKRIIPSKNGSNFQVLLTNEGNSPNCIISSGLQILSPVSIKPVSSKNSTTAMFADLKSQKAQYIIITNKKLWNKATEYANYRNLKGYNVLLLDADELYNQFGYGITKHPGAIRNYCKFAMKYSPVKPEYLFVIGKSYHTKLYRNNPSLFNQCLVPSAGNPSSDALLTWKLSGSSYAPALATGRLAALTEADIDGYLNKVREYESTPGAAWMKNVLQFSGGSNAEEELTMRTHIMGYQRIFEAPLFGANVQNFYKNSSLPIANAQSDIIKQSINNGVSILCFFGHASAGGFDQNIDLPSSYDNKGKYPFLMANSCYSGDINNTGLPGISEQWVMIKDRGTIGFLANVDLGYDYYLDLFSSQLVTNISSTNYQGTIGKSILNSIQFLEKQDQSSSLIKLTSLDLILHGDPAIKTNGFTKPDLVADVKYISFKPAIISTDIDSFQVKYVVVNEGRAFTDTFMVQVKRTFPNGKTNFLNFKVPGVRSRDTLSFYLPIGGILAAGMNKLEIFLDKNDTISEINEANNSLNYSFIVISTDLIPVYPYKYAIYPNDTVTFIACCPNPYVKYRTAKCQLDLSAKFDSPSLLTAATEYNNGYFTCKMPIRFVANQVYYWRVEIDKGDGNLKWNSSSFIYIPGKTGWSQADFYQFNEDDYKYLSWNEQFKNFNFINSPVRLFCSTKGNLSSEAEWNYVKYTMDGGMKSWSSCGIASAFNVAVLDSSTLIPWPSNRADFFQRNYPGCSAISGRIEASFAFTSTDKRSVGGMGAMFNYGVPNGNYILVYTWMNGHFDSMQDTVIQAFEKLGAKRIRSIASSNPNAPYIFFVKKGSPETAVEIVGGDNELIQLNQDLKYNYYQGDISSMLIGPSNLWSKFSQKLVKDSADINNFTLTAVNQKSQEKDIATLVQTDIDTLNKIIDAKAFPYMKLSLSTSDIVKRTPSQLKSWQVYYDEYPEGAISITSKSLFYADTLQEGDMMKMVIAFKNISSYAMDSVMVNYSITDNNNQLISLITKRLKALKAGEILSDSITFSTTNHVGTNLVTVEFNPFNSAKGTYDQLEQYHFNNLAQKYFHVLKDKRNPLFDVTFDGFHIMNGDIVSAKPEIKISLKDENKFFILDDTSLVQVYLKSLTDNKEQRLQFSSNSAQGELKFTPGTSKNNKAIITYNPVFTADGQYQLRVKGKDKSGNISGKSDYSINFEIILKSSITNLINYPNPFTTATRFVFTLTGSEIPTDLRIQIFTITGKMIKEISLNELGLLHIGRNITQFAWDGTDAYGDKLANGVYLYRVFSSIRGNQIDHRGAEIDQYFKKGFGKMYLMR